jgi:hypothetical protein
MSRQVRRPRQGSDEKYLFAIGPTPAGGIPPFIKWENDSCRFLKPESRNFANSSVASFCCEVSKSERITVKAKGRKAVPCRGDCRERVSMDQRWRASEMIAGAVANPRPTAPNAPPRRAGPVNVAAEIDRQLEVLIRNIVQQLMGVPGDPDRPSLSAAEARMDAMVMLSVTIQAQAEPGNEGEEFMLWLLEEKQKREMS